MPKKRKSLARGLIGVGIGITAGALISDKLGAPSGITHSFTTAASFMPVATLGVMGMHTVDIARKGLKKNKRRSIF